MSWSNGAASPRRLGRAAAIACSCLGGMAAAPAGAQGFAAAVTPPRFELSVAPGAT
jgi:hypothetical protein